MFDAQVSTYFWSCSVPPPCRLIRRCCLSGLQPWWLVLGDATQSWVNKRVQQKTKDTPLGAPGLSPYAGGVVAIPHSLWSAHQEVQDPVAEGGVQNQHSHIDVPLVQMCYGPVNNDGNCIFCGSVGVVDKMDWVKCACHADLDVGHDRPLEALHDDRGESNGSIVIWASHLVFLGHWDDGGLRKAGGDYSLGQVDDVPQDASQLVNTHSEDTARDPMWAGSFVSFSSF